MGARRSSGAALPCVLLFILTLGIGFAAALVLRLGLRPAQLVRAGWRQQLSGATAAAAAAAASARPRCAVSTVPLGALPPALVASLAPPCRPAALAAAADGARPGDANVLFSRYRVSRVLARAAAARRDSAAAIDAGGGGSAATLLFADDREIDAALYCADSRRVLPNGTAEWDAAWPQLIALRASRLRAALRAAAAARAVVVYADTWPSDAWQRPDAQLARRARLYRLVLDVDHVPRADVADASRYLVVPYAAYADDGAAGEAPPPPPPPPASPPLLFLDARCAAGGSGGMRLRAALVAELAGEADAVARCTRSWRPPAAYLAEQHAATFCLIVAGDVPSTSRLTDAMRGAAGGGDSCVPVIVGPPWPLLPLLPAVAYARFALFVNLTAAAAAAGAPPEPGDAWAAEPRMAALLAALRPPALLQAADGAALAAALRALPRARIAQLRAAAAAFRAPFGAAWDAAPAARAGADALIDAVCAAVSSSGGGGGGGGSDQLEEETPLLLPVTGSIH